MVNTKQKKRFGDARDEMARPPCTMPARQRDGKPYAGGRALRRAMRRLKSAQALHANNKASASEQKMPGAMHP